jgi:2-hydroxychromene-2-carboxylate isomerase
MRRKLGHYVGGSFHFEGEWYWGCDRLHYLTDRLAAAGLAAGEQPTGMPGALREGGELRAAAAGNRPRLDFFASLRSPYTYLAAARIRRLAERFGADLRIRYVLPMVMRGLAVPAAKRMYIVLDAKREAERLGLPFGRIADPVGAGAERGLAVLAGAIAAGRGCEFLESFLAGVFAEGIDAAGDQGLERIAARAGIERREVQRALADPSWRVTADANRRELFELGLWGVPSFCVDGLPAHWGQDRLWAVEQDLRSRTSAAARHVPGQAG